MERGPQYTNISCIARFKDKWNQNLSAKTQNKHCKESKPFKDVSLYKVCK